MAGFCGYMAYMMNSTTGLAHSDYVQLFSLDRKHPGILAADAYSSVVRCRRCVEQTQGYLVIGRGLA